MPKLTNSFPSLRKHRASGQAEVTIAGKDYYLGPHGSKTALRAYDAKIAEWLASGRSSSFGIAQVQLTVAQLLNSYRKFAEQYYGMDEKSTYHDMVRAASRIKELYACIPICDFGPLQFKAIRQKMIDAKLARVCVNKTMSFILKIIKWGMAESMVEQLGFSNWDFDLLVTMDGISDVTKLSPVPAFPQCHNALYRCSAMINRFESFFFWPSSACGLGCNPTDRDLLLSVSYQAVGRRCAGSNQ